MKKSYRMIGLGMALLVCAIVLGWAQEQKSDRAVVPLTNPGKPALIKVGVLNGGITVKGYEGKEVIVEARTRERKLSGEDEEDEITPTPPAVAAPPVAPTMDAWRQQRKHRDRDREEKVDKSAGMKRLSVASTGLEVEEADNVVTISTETWKNTVDLVIQVPVGSNLELSSTNDGEIVVENVSGEMEVSNINDSITLRNVSGNVVAHTVNGDITVGLLRVAPDKPMSFSTMNGDVDVTLPADAKANLKLKSNQGEVYSDFDIALKQAPQKSEEASKSEKGKYRISFDKYIIGALNGGGPEYVLNTFNGDIYIRKKK
jgi:hypothetical protein